MDNIFNIKPCTDLANSLRDIASGLENGALEGDSCTLIINNAVFHLGTFDDDKALEKSIFDMTFGIHKLMNSVTQEY